MPSRFAIRMHMAVIALARLIAILWMPLAAYCATRLLYAVSAFDSGTAWPGESIGWAIAFYAVLTFSQGAFIYLLAMQTSKIADWVVPAARNRCPACGYSRSGASADKCAECSLSFES
jgi:hypothetical protein